MSASLKKLKIGGGKLSAADVVGYLIEPQDVGDYYTEDSQAVMTWFATDRVRTLFALSDEVHRGKLEKLIEGIDPVTGESIRRRGADGTIVGAIDLTVSPAPKSVSVLWALADDALRYELEIMVAGAVAAAVGRMLREQPLTRERYGPGARDVAPAVATDYIGARVMHTAARLSANSDGVPDPQLHVHNLLIGAVDETGSLRAIDSLAVLRYCAELDAEASGHLAEMLRQRGFTIVRHLERRRNGQPRVTWEIAGVPPALIQAMSSRTSEIEDLRRKYEETYGREASGPAWDAWVALQRGPKARLSSPELRVEWTLEAERHGFGLAAVDDLVAAADGRRAAGIEDRDERGSEATVLRRLMLEHICRDHAFVPFAHMERLARQLAVGLLDPRTTDAVIADMIDDGDLLVTADDQVTTLEVLQHEQRARAAAAELLAAPPEKPLAAQDIDAELERRSRDGRPFDERQAAAVRLAVGGARFVSITGPAGTGKGYASSAMAVLWRDQGRRVIAAAVAGRTAQQAAADAGADQALNLNLLLTRLEHGLLDLGPDDVILVDEAGMVDHRRYTPLLETAARSGATLVQVGDDRQLSPVGPGGLWTVTHGMAEAAGRAVELDMVRRARDPREAKAWTDLRHGRIAEGLTWMRDASRLHLYETRLELLEGLVAAWWAGERDGLMVVDTSNTERDRLNELAQARRLEAGELGLEAVRLANGRELHRGDRVLFSGIHRPARQPGQRRIRRVENGTPAVVVNVDPVRERVVLELQEGKHVRRLEAGPEVPVELGYARHVAKAQGVTREDTDVAVSRRTQRNELYVMATRARAGARLHVVASDAGEVLEPHAEPAMTAMTQTQAAVLERHGVKPDPTWSWVQASLQIDLAVGTPVGRQAELWLHAQGHSREAAARIVEETRHVGSEPPQTDRPAGPMLASELLAQLEAERTRRAAQIEHATIESIHQQAERPSTKEAVGERTIQAGSVRAAAYRATVAGRRAEDRGEISRSGEDTERRWTHSYRLDRDAPREAAAHAARGGAIRRPPRAAELPPHPMPARDVGESVLGRRTSAELTAALGYYQLVGRLEQSPDVVARAVELLSTDVRTVVIATTPDLWRAIRERAEAAGLSLHSDGQQRVVVAEPAYHARHARRESWLAGQPPESVHLVEPGAIPSAYVIADDPWNSIPLAQGLSVAAESKVVLPVLPAPVARSVAIEADRWRAALEAHAELNRAMSATHAREAAYERGAEAEVPASAERARDTERGGAGR
jgi:conjugative relaxase-like TrwC/TraI family protein